MIEEQATTDSRDIEQFLATARKRFEDASSDEGPIREQALLDLRFEAGDQWDARIKNERTVKGRPALTFNRCHTFVQLVSNEARQNKPQIKFVPDDAGDPDTAEVKEGLARHIQYCSDAQIAYETAVEYAAGGSFGYFGFLTDYTDDDSWDQDLKVRTIYDPFSVYGVLIPNCFGMEPQWAFVIEEIPTEDYKRQYPDSDATKDFDLAIRNSGGWVATDTVRVAEYWYVEHSTKTIKRKNPRTGKPETREIDVCTVKFCKINGYEILKNTETEWPGYCIPIIPVLGKQRILDGKPHLFSVIRFQRDPQQLINFYKTRIAETLGTQPIQPYMVAEGSIPKSREKEWKTLNSATQPYMVFRAFDAEGRALPPPARQTVEPPIQSYSEAAAQEIDDMKATTGIYDASLGNKSNEASGIALQRRQQQANITNMHFMDNLERAFKKGGLIIADLIPKIYDTKRMVQILGPDEAPKIAKINVPHVSEGKEVHYKVGGEGAQKDEPIVTMERGFSTKRMESFDMMTSVLQAQPDLMGVIGDLFFSNSDMAGSDIMAERIKRFIQMKNPGLIEDKNNPMPPEAQTAIAQAQQQVQVLGQELQKLQAEKQGKVVEGQWKSDIERLKLETNVLIAEIQTKAQNQSERMEMFLDTAKQLLSQAHEHGMQAADQAHERDMADINAQIQQNAAAQQAALNPQQPGAAQ